MGKMRSLVRRSVPTSVRTSEPWQFFVAVRRHWIALVAGALFAVLSVASYAADTARFGQLPSWVFVVAAALAIIVACFRAWHDERKQVVDLQKGLAEYTTAPYAAEAMKPEYIGDEILRQTAWGEIYFSKRTLLWVKVTNNGREPAEFSARFDLDPQTVERLDRGTLDDEYAEYLAWEKVDTRTILIGPHGGHERIFALWCFVEPFVVWFFIPSHHPGFPLVPVRSELEFDLIITNESSKGDPHRYRARVEFSRDNRVSGFTLEAVA